MFSYGPPHMAKQKQDDQLEPTYSSSVRIRDVALRTYQKWWTIGRSGKRGSEISVLAARHDDDDDEYRSSWPTKHFRDSQMHNSLQDSKSLSSIKLCESNKQNIKAVFILHVVNRNLFRILLIYANKS